MSEKLLRVTGKSFCAGAMFAKLNGAWVMTDCAPYLRKIIGKTQVDKIGELLRKKGFNYEWLDTQTEQSK